LLSNCSSQGSTQGTRTLAHQAVPEELEIVHSFVASEKSVSFVVSGFGCTQKSHFEVRQERSEPGRLTLVRLKKDNCRRKKKATKITFSREELFISSEQVLTLQNPVKPFVETQFKNARK